MIDRKILPPDELKSLLDLDRGNGRKIVFTNGCFDIIHAGHVRYLEEARLQGNRLIVALNTDASTSRLKGPSRPVNTLADRLQVVAALSSVDYVTWFEEDTPLELIMKLHPDILVKGGDWKADQIVGGREVVAWGGEVRSLVFMDGRSTTEMIRKISQNTGK